MKKVLKKIFIKILSNDRVGRWSYDFSRFAWKIKFQRELIEREKSEIRLQNLVTELFRDLNVLDGPFKEMKYPALRSISSALYPKLLGCYEKELDEIILEIMSKPYEQLLDIGCAEGYYAVGLALKMPQLKVYAYDIDSEARTQTKEMAQLNGVEQQIVIASNCTADTLSNFDFTKRSLIISDCEGYEKELFTKQNIHNLRKVDLLIETHDFIDINISTDLEKLFENSHDLIIIQSIGDVIKAKTYQIKALEGQDLKIKYRMLEEGRRFVDEWLYLKAKN